MRIAVDAMGTDANPAPDVAGTVLAAHDFNETMILVGDKKQVEAELAKQNTSNLSLEVVHAVQQVTMDDKPASVGKAKPGSSMHVGLQLVKDGKADAFVTAGNTGAALSIATLHSLGRIRGIKRPALTVVAELNGNLIILVDAGANTDSKLDWLKQFAMMGDLYANRVLQIEQPRVGLLSNGTEDGKGDQLVRDANIAFQEMALNFVGNIEPIDLISGNVDVAVTDGYVGNILMKTYEAAMKTVFRVMRTELTSDLRAKLGASLARPYLQNTVKKLDPTQFGGAPLLGINGIVIIAHGSSDATIMRNAIYQAIRAHESNIIDVIKQGLSAS